MLAGEILESMYAQEPQPGLDGVPFPLDAVTKISREQARYLYDLWKETSPENSLEIGLAFGFSTACILSARYELNKGHHMAIDPFQMTTWGGVGAAVAERLGLSDHFTFLEEYSEIVLPAMIEKKQEFQYIFIDGNHTFDAAFVDFTLSARVLSEGGVIVFDDMWMPAIRTVTSFVENNRSDFRRLESPVKNVAVFRRIEDDKRPWDHFVPFRVHAKRGLPRSSLLFRRILRNG